MSLWVAQLIQALADTPKSSQGEESCVGAKRTGWKSTAQALGRLHMRALAYFKRILVRFLGLSVSFWVF